MASEQPALHRPARPNAYRFVHYGHDPSDIPANAEILEIVAGLNAEFIQENFA